MCALPRWRATSFPEASRRTVVGRAETWKMRAARLSGSRITVMGDAPTSGGGEAGSIPSSERDSRPRILSAPPG